MYSLLSVLLALTGGALSVLLGVLAIRWLDRPAKPALIASDLIAPCIFLFRGDGLADATAPARAILAGCSGSGLPGLKSWLAQHFGDISALDRIAELGGRAELAGQGHAGSPPMRLLAEETEDGALRLTLIQPESEAAGIVVDSISHQAMEEELALLRGIVEGAPMMISRRDDQDRIVWANAAYLDASAEDDPAAARWPLPDILQADPAPGAEGRGRRARIERGDETHWFDCHDHPDETGVTTYALPADAQVRAEQSLREFLQTLTKTFADLPIGLAIFDRERQLQLFNPALIDLTGLSAGFLTSRPSLYSVLDQLRELRMVPEPRDYRSWRRQITTLEMAASAGHHVETWSLPGGQTYRVTGRPHPGGAVAFLFDDITSEITLTRKFRAELTLGSQILDGLEQALIVFNAVGQVVMTNSAYTDLWGERPERMADALRHWRGDWSEAPGLQELDAALNREDRPASQRGVLFGRGDTGVVGWTVTPLPGGKRMVRFSQTGSAESGRPAQEPAGPAPAQIQGGKVAG